MAKSTDRFHEYARLGAAIRRGELVAEMRAIDKAFPELRFQKRTAALLKTSGSPATRTCNQRLAGVPPPITTATLP